MVLSIWKIGFKKIVFKILHIQIVLDNNKSSKNNEIYCYIAEGTTTQLVNNTNFINIKF